MRCNLEVCKTVPLVMVWGAGFGNFGSIPGMSCWELIASNEKELMEGLWAESLLASFLNLPLLLPLCRFLFLLFLLHLKTQKILQKMS